MMKTYKLSIEPTADNLNKQILYDHTFHFFRGVSFAFTQREVYLKIDRINKQIFEFIFTCNSSVLVNRLKEEFDCYGIKIEEIK